MVIHAEPKPEPYIRVTSRKIDGRHIEVEVDKKTADAWHTLHGRALKSGFTGKARTEFLEYHYKVLAKPKS